MQEAHQMKAAKKIDYASDLIAVTYVKCAPGQAKLFEREFGKELNQPKQFTDKNTGHLRATVTPRVLASTAGYFDYLIVMETDSTEAISRYCLDILRSGSMTKLVIDTQTTVAVINRDLQLKQD